MFFFPDLRAFWIHFILDTSNKTATFSLDKFRKQLKQKYNQLFTNSVTSPERPGSGAVLGGGGTRINISCTSSIIIMLYQREKRKKHWDNKPTELRPNDPQRRNSLDKNSEIALNYLCYQYTGQDLTSLVDTEQLILITL